MNTQRFSWIDNAKAFAIIAVIWMHVGKLIPAEFDYLPFMVFMILLLSLGIIKIGGKYEVIKNSFLGKYKII